MLAVNARPGTAPDHALIRAVLTLPHLAK